MSKSAKKTVKKAGRPLKPGPKMDETIRFMVLPSDGQRYREAAAVRRLDLSEWIRRACDAAAAADLAVDVAENDSGVITGNG